MKRCIVLLIIAVLISGCSADITNLTIAKKNVRDYYESGIYDEEMNSITASALKEFENIKFDNNSAAVIDIDECALSNYPL